MERGSNRVAPFTPWGKALEILRERRERESGGRYSQYQLAKEANIPQSEYRNLLRRGVRGPSVTKIDALLRAMQYTWNDWGTEYETVLKQEATIISRASGKPMNKGSHSKKNIKPAINGH